MKEKTLKETKDFLENTASELATLADFDRMEMYRLLGQFADEIPAIADDEKREENFVQGCVSNVYIGHTVESGRIEYRGSSEAIIVRGFLAILITALSGLSLINIVEETQPIIEQFCNSINLRAHLTPSRANAFGNVYIFMRAKAKDALTKEATTTN